MAWKHKKSVKVIHTGAAHRVKAHKGTHKGVHHPHKGVSGHHRRKKG